MFIVNKKEKLNSIIFFTLATIEYVRSKISYYLNIITKEIKGIHLVLPLDDQK